MFRFFPDEDPAGDQSSETSGPSPKSSQDHLRVYSEVLVRDSHYSLASHLKSKAATPPAQVSVSKSVSLHCVNLSELLASDGVVKDEKVIDILKSTSDLVSGVYEGGFKTWECTFDLIKYVQENFEAVFQQTRKDKPLRILDLGCGSGLAGLAVLALAEERGVDVRVDFQDYNDEVLDYVTVPNTLLNFDDERAAKCRYFSGDWDSFRTKLFESCEANSSEDYQSYYDVILSSETIYNVEYFPKILRILKSCLRPGTGCLYLAAKTFYFGVGGGTKAFLNMITEDGSLEGSVLHVIKEGVQREILSVRPGATGD